MFNSWFYFSYHRHKNLRTSLFWVFRKKENFASMIFGKFCYVACTINHIGKLICLCICLHKHYCAGLVDKPAFGSGQKTPSNFLNLLKYSNFKKAFLRFFYQEIWNNEYANIFDHISEFLPRITWNIRFYWVRLYSCILQKR